MTILFWEQLQNIDSGVRRVSRGTRLEVGSDALSHGAGSVKLIQRGKGRSVVSWP